MRYFLPLLAILAGCAAQPPQQYVYEWAKPTPRPATQPEREAIFRQDEAACEYEVAMAMRQSPQRQFVNPDSGNPYTEAVTTAGTAVLDGGNRDYYKQLCLRAKGWQRVQ
jgi:hypothetical protein